MNSSRAAILLSRESFWFFNWLIYPLRIAYFSTISLNLVSFSAFPSSRYFSFSFRIVIYRDPLEESSLSILIGSSGTIWKVGGRLTEVARPKLVFFVWHILWFSESSLFSSNKLSTLAWRILIYSWVKI